MDLPIPDSNLLSIRACLVEGMKVSVSDDGLNLPDKRVDPGCWLSSNPNKGNLVLASFWISSVADATLSSDANVSLMEGGG